MAVASTFSSGSYAESEATQPAGNDLDVEQGAVDELQLRNTTVHNISWKGVTVTVKDRETKLPKTIVDNVEGIVKAGMPIPPPTNPVPPFTPNPTQSNQPPLPPLSTGEICALMGPSGSGKTTLLNFLAARPGPERSSASGTVLLNGVAPSRSAFRKLSCFVEQEDALIGSLTVRETLLFASRLSGSRSGGGGGGARKERQQRAARVDGLLDAFGLRGQADTLVGTPLRKGISGGQKRRVGVASQLITSPKVLFLDEPTSGLDSAAGLEVVKYLREVAKRNKVGSFSGCCCRSLLSLGK